MPTVGYWELTLMVLAPALLVASIIDYRQHKVPNWLNGALAAGGLIVQGVCHGWWDGQQYLGVGGALLGVAVGLATLIVAWAMGGMGGGDVKLMAAIGAWVGPWVCFVSFCAGAMIGGVIAVAIILIGKRDRKSVV